MKIEVKFTTKRAFIFLLCSLILLGISGVIAYTIGLGSVPNPGHPLSNIQGYFSGDPDLQASLGKLCQSDGTNCVSTPFPAVYQKERNCPQNTDCPIDCDAGDSVVGGGFHSGSAISPTWYSRPQSDLSGWECYMGASNSRCYAVCLNIV